MGAKAVAKIGKRVEGAIVRVRDERVILDEELAALYGVTTKALNQAVRRNRARFPSDFGLFLRRTRCSCSTHLQGARRIGQTKFPV